MAVLNEDLSASLIYQKVFNSELEFKVKAVSGNNYKVISKILGSKKTKTYKKVDGEFVPNTITKDGYILIDIEETKKRFTEPSDIVENMSKVIPYLVGKDNEEIRVLVAYPENGMYLRSQRDIVYEILKYLVGFANNNLEKCKTIDVVFVTNSPILLSDISEGNVTVFIEGNDNPQNVKLKQHAGTFSANLYSITCSILPEGDSGVIGKVAVDLLYNFKERIQNKHYSYEDCLKICSLVDDPFLSRTLENLTESEFHLKR